MKVKSKISVHAKEDVILKASNNIDELSADQFFELVGELYKKAGYVNKVTIKLHGIHNTLRSKIKITPPPFEEVPESKENQ